MDTPTSTIADGTVELQPRSGTAIIIKAGQILRIIDPLGKQVSDILAFNSHEKNEFLSNGRSFDYAGKIYFSTGDILYSNRSNPMLKIINDTVGRHDFLFTPCSADTFRIKFPDQEPHRGCHGNFVAALERYGISEEKVTIPFNVFMNVRVGENGEIKVEAPLSKAGDYIEFRAEMDLIVAITACSAARSNDGSFKPIHFKVYENKEPPS